MPDMTGSYRIEFHLVNGLTVATELTAENLGEMRQSGLYAIPADVDEPEVNRRILRTRLAYLISESTGHIVTHDKSGAEWVIPINSVVAATFTEPGTHRQVGFQAAGILGLDVLGAPFRVIEGGKP